MSVKKTIAIVGATEETGREISRHFMQADYRLLLVSNNKDQLDYLSKSINDKKPKAEIDSIDCVKDGCWEADIIILTVPFHEEKKVAEMMKEVATQKIVVTISDDENNNGTLQQLLPYSRLVKVSGILNSKKIFISGDDEEANEEVSSIFNQAGYHPENKFTIYE
ncbi:MAG TPA: NAD(P)-binding domain-containing protein [Hanamia sp.]|nr:NAD(P)-binding domain-containing protein [Hanamia sp.]